MPHSEESAQTDRWRHRRGSPEFARLLNLSDGVFAIAMTLLVLGIDPAAVTLSNVSGVFVNQPGELIAFAISFAVIANFWWIHHRFFAALALIEPGLMLINLVLLGLIALVPFPTSLLGRDPTAPGAAVPYLALIALIAVVHVLLLLRADRAQAWKVAMPAGMLPWLLAGWGASAAATLLAFGVSFFAPLAGLLMLLLTWPVEALVAYRAPEGYRAWG
ncbi:MAG: TMEM175 family protein [Microcella sp.]|nr:TMEM175 family protein [Microcella sp.]